MPSRKKPVPKKPISNKLNVQNIKDKDKDKSKSKLNNEFNKNPKSQMRRNNWTSNVTDDTNSLRTIFEKESTEVIEKRKLEAKTPINFSTIKEEVIYYGETLDIPTRPEWTYEMSKEELETKENLMFIEYLKKIYDQHPRNNLNMFEHNLEVWRQLWRVCETSDVLCVLADIRHPIFHFPPSLYKYIVNYHKKTLVLVLTKADLVPPELVEKWIAYFKQHFPNMHIVSVNSMVKFETDLTKCGSKKKKRIVYKGINRYNGQWMELILVLNKILFKKGAQSIKLPENLVFENSDESDHDSDESDCNDNISDENVNENNVNENNNDKITYKRPYTTIGFIGSPNVGKSTLINALFCRKICSESRTPGHTKHRQTLYLNPTVVVADCPGLVFPAVNIPRELQILCGIFPIAQCREPYSVIKYLGGMVQLKDTYKLDKIDHDDVTAYDICEAYAERKGYCLKGGRMNTHRAGTEILQHAVDGKIAWCFDPDHVKINIQEYIGNDVVENDIIGNDIVENDIIEMI